MYEAMKKYGGSFVQSLADCLIHADVFNYKKLETAFPEYFEEYRGIGKNLKLK